jgi:large subunit ribosomal protein L2
VQYPNGALSYIIAPQHLKAGDSVMSSRTRELDLKPGNSMPLSLVPIGTVVHNLELHPGRGGQLARAAGTSCTLVDKNGRPGFGLVELASKEQRYINLHCMASIGVVSNPLAKLIKLGKAGRARWAGRRPHVRGCAMNPVDHPLGGGHSAKGRQPCSQSGVLSKGFKTRRKNKINNHIVVPRGGIQKGAGGQFAGGGAPTA